MPQDDQPFISDADVEVSLREEGRARISDPSLSSPEDERVQRMLEHTIDVGVLADAVEQQQAADAADTLETLEGEEAAGVLEEMDVEAAAQALAEINRPLAATLLHDLVEEDPARAARIVEEMAPDDAADLLQAVDERKREQILTLIEDEPAEQLSALVSHDAESAGGLMTTEFLALHESMTVGEAIEYIRAHPELSADHFHYYALVIDDDDRLAGIVSLRDILITPNSQPIADVMERQVEVVRPDLDREEVARTFDRYDYSILPVVSETGVLLGLVTVDDVIDIIREEQTEDVQRSVGAGKGEAVYSPLRDKLKGRTPWLGLSLGLMCGSAIVVLFGEKLIEERPVLAFMLPVIAAVVGNGGQQAMMVTLRGIVLNEIRRERVWPLIMREVSVGAINGVILGMLIALLIGGVAGAFVESATWEVGIVGGIAMAVAMSVATLTGSSVPLLMRRVGLDPAVAASIFLIMITDAVSFCTLLALTTVLLKSGVV